MTDKTHINLDEATVRRIIREELKNESKPTWWETHDEENPMDDEIDHTYGCNTFRLFNPNLTRGDVDDYMGVGLPNKRFEREYNRDLAYMLGVDPKEMSLSDNDEFVNLSEKVAREVVSEIDWKGAALGALMGASVLGGMNSCTGPVNPARSTEITQQGHIDFPDYSDRPWAFQNYIGRTIEANYLVVEDKSRIKTLLLNLPANDSVYQAEGYGVPAIFQDCAWAIFYEKTEQRDKYNVDIFHSHGQPLYDKPYEGVYYDGECYFELWYDRDESKPMKDRVQFIRIYRNEQNKNETTWNVTLDYAKANGRVSVTGR